MSKKSLKILLLLEELRRKLTCDGSGDFELQYLGYFECFNQQRYYEAHDVLEELWLRIKKTRNGESLFYKGLIQLAGAFVHLQKSRLNPAARLLRLTLKNLEPWQPQTKGLDVQELVKRIQGWLAQLENSHYANNPYNPNCPPRIHLIRST